MKKSLVIAVILFIAWQASIYALSTAEEIETLLATDAVSYAQAARFILEASGVLAVSDRDEAFSYAKEQSWLPKNAAPDIPARLDGISKLMLESFGLSGGIMYRLTKMPHYAYLQLVYNNIIQGMVIGKMQVSGEYLLFIISRMLSLAAPADEAAVTTPADETPIERREALAAEISAQLIEHEIADTTVEVGEEGITITLSNIQFLADSAVLHQSEIPKLQEIGIVLESVPGIRIRVSGHTALAGTAENRLIISRERARAVADYLVAIGACDPDNIIYIGYGAERSIADNSTEEGRALNRRVEITILEND